MAIRSGRDRTKAGNQEPEKLQSGLASRPSPGRSRHWPRLTGFAFRRQSGRFFGGSGRAVSPLVPPHSVSRRALLALVAIMSFLACLSIAAVSIISQKANGWQRQIADEVTIQIRPIGNDDIAAAVARSVEIAVQTPGVISAEPLSEDTSAALLEPWLGSDFDRSQLPIPRLVAVNVDDSADLDALARRLRESVPGASLDDHGLWLERLSTMANTVTLGGLFITGLVFAATALSVVFATRGAMAGNRDVIEVLHFVGAEDIYIANQFQRHFLVLGLRGAAIGGLAAVTFLFLANLVVGAQGPTPEEAQIRSLFGAFSLGIPGSLAAFATIIATGLLIAVTARITVYATLRKID